MLHKGAFHQGLHCLLLKMKTIFKDRNTSFYRNFDQQPLKIQNVDDSILIVSICMGLATRMKRVTLISKLSCLSFSCDDINVFKNKWPIDPFYLASFKQEVSEKIPQG